jgi:hypothetical protein
MAAPRRDAVATLPALRTLGTGAQQAAAGDHGHGGAAITGSSGSLGDVLTVTSTSPLEATWQAPSGGGGGGGGLTASQARSIAWLGGL